MKERGYVTGTSQYMGEPARRCWRAPPWEGQHADEVHQSALTSAISEGSLRVMDDKSIDRGVTAILSNDHIRCATRSRTDASPPQVEPPRHDTSCLPSQTSTSPLSSGAMKDDRDSPSGVQSSCPPTPESLAVNSGRLPRMKGSRNVSQLFRFACLEIAYSLVGKSIQFPRFCI